MSCAIGAVMALLEELKGDWEYGGEIAPDTRFIADLGLDIEMLALFIRQWLIAVPAVPESAQAAARAKGADRYAAFVEALGRRMASGNLLIREVSQGLSENASSESTPPK